MTTRHRPVSTDKEGQLALRQAFGSFATGVTIVTTRQSDGTPRGFTANSFTSVSLDPPLLLVCLGKSALSCDSFAAAEHFAVSILADDQRDVSGLFASKAPDKFDLSDWTSGPDNMPLIDGALASFTCARHQLVDAGDHLILIGKVQSHASRDGNPLGFFRGAYFDIGLEDQVADALVSGGRVSISALLANGDAVLMIRHKDGSLAIPKAPPDANTIEHLETSLRSDGLTPDLGHLYAVFHDSGSNTHSIVYHGQVSGQPKDGMEYVDLFSLPPERVQSEAERSLIRRYQQEFRHGSFGIYHGSESHGHVYAVDDTRKA